MIKIFFIKDYDTYKQGQAYYVEMKRARGLISSGIAIELEEDRH